jgi:hypothetical protein
MQKSHLLVLQIQQYCHGWKSLQKYLHSKIIGKAICATLVSKVTHCRCFEFVQKTVV